MNKTNWKYRRRTVTFVLVYCFAVTIYLLGWGHGESLLHDTIASNTLLLIFLTLGGYVFGRGVDTHAGAEGEAESAHGRDTQLGSWEQRRKAIFVTLLFCGGSVGYLLYRGEDTTLNATLASGLCLLAAGVTGSYIFGATYDDYAIRQRLGGK